ncbi:DUF1761 family protein [Yeosuana sp.]|uniref:DUF1761 family protein n=1 Tax=Yeosuana sp. TaxID=2529388 RepID=UPI004054E7F2|tara:strand:- start:679 stop:1071 length:393 start_codon:yes stop_codon:yes gene_type:complete
MKAKNFLGSGIAGGVANFFLGWLFYGIIFKDSFPQPAEGPNSIVYIALGSLIFGLFIAYIFTKWAQITTIVTGAKAGAVIGLFLSLFMNLFNMAMNSEATFQMFATDLGIAIVSTAITGAIIGYVNGKMG